MNIVHTVDCIIRYKGGIVLIDRQKEPYGMALPGGKLEENETLEAAAEREAREETNLSLENLTQFHTYSAPGRDPRFRAISTVFTADGIGELRAASDAKSVHVLLPAVIHAFRDKFAFDHGDILADYLSAEKK